METLKYAYRPRVTIMGLMLAFFSVCAAVSYHCALTNDQALILRGIRLDAGQATVLFWILAAMSTALALFGLFGAVRGMISGQALIMDATAVSLPKSGFSDTVVTVAYDAIMHTKMREMKGERLLTIEYVGGKVSVAQSLLSDAATFSSVVHALTERVALAKRMAEIKDSAAPDRRPGR